MHEAVHVNYAWGRPPTCMRPYTYAAWGRTRTLHEAVHHASYFPHFLLFKQYVELKAVCIWMHIVRKEFRSWIHCHKQTKIAFFALKWKCYKRTRAISRVRLYPVLLHNISDIKQNFPLGGLKMHKTNIFSQILKFQHEVQKIFPWLSCLFWTI